MTVGELRKKIKGIDSEVPVAVLLNDGSESAWYEISALSLEKGTPSIVDGKSGFIFDDKGTATWLFIDVTEY
jgi:hypothetical protein